MEKYLLAEVEFVEQYYANKTLLSWKMQNLPTTTPYDTQMPFNVHFCIHGDYE